MSTHDDVTPAPLLFTLEDLRQMSRVDALIADAANQRGERVYLSRVDAGELDDDPTLTTQSARARFVATLAGDYAFNPPPITDPKHVADVECLRFVRPHLTHAEAVSVLGHDDAPEPPEPWSVMVERAQLHRVTVPPPVRAATSTTAQRPPNRCPAPLGGIDVSS